MLAENINERATGQAISSAGGSYELRLPEHYTRGNVYCAITDAAALVDAYLRLETQLPDAQGGSWIPMPQEASLLSVDTGTPDVINGNTAAATAVVNGVAKNCSGITDIDDNGTFLLTFQATGRPVRLVWDCTSGTATLAIDVFGQAIIS